MNEASHLFSMSFNVASGVDFFVGISAADGAGFFDASVVFEGEDDFVGPDGELLFFGVGDSAFSGEIDTLGSVAGDSAFSDAVDSGAGAGVSS
jgi:hypothetical protein